MKTDEPKTNGCPANPWGAPAGASDRDKDRVPDSLDACPDVAGVKTDDPRTNGCPAQAVAPIVKKNIAPAAIPVAAPTAAPAAVAPAASAAPADPAPPPTDTPKKVWYKPWTWFY
jgi:hypothetical protein